MTIPGLIITYVKEQVGERGVTGTLGKKTKVVTLYFWIAIIIEE